METILYFPNFRYFRHQVLCVIFVMTSRYANQQKSTDKPSTTILLNLNTFFTCLINCGLDVETEPQLLVEWWDSKVGAPGISAETIPMEL